MRRTWLMPAFVLLFGAAASGQPAFTVIAQSGGSAPQTSATYAGLSAPSINVSGQVAFFADLAGAGVTPDNNTAVIAGLPGSLDILARGGMAAPGTPSGVTFANVADLTAPRFNDQGHVLFLSTLAGPGVDSGRDFGYWVASPQGIQIVTLSRPFAEEPPYPAFPLRRPVFSSGDRAAWSSNEGLQLWSPANPTGRPVGSIVEAPVLNSAGSLAFLRSSDNGLAVTVAPGGSGTTQVLAVAGQAAPGTPAGTRFTQPLFPTINAAGQTAFYAFIDTDPPIPFSEFPKTTGLWRGTPGPAENSPQVELIARGGDAAPGTGGMRFGAFNLDIDSYRPPVISGSGEVAFTTSLGVDPTHTTGSGLFAGSPGHLRLVAQNGQSATGAPPSVELGQFDTTIAYMNAAGQIAFLQSDAGKFSLYAADVDGTLQFLAAEGYPFQLASGDARMVSGIKFGDVGGGLEDGNPSPLNDAGQLAFTLVFSDNTQAALLTTIPEPSAMALLLGTSLLLMRRRGH
jgi:hypothetical protein